MSEFTRAGDIQHEATPPPKIGDVYRDRAMLKRPAGGSAHIVDVIEIDGVPQRVVLEDDLGKRTTINLLDLRRRYVFRTRAQ